MVNISSERQNIWTTELALNATRNGEPKLRKKQSSYESFETKSKEVSREQIERTARIRHPNNRHQFCKCT